MNNSVPTVSLNNSVPTVSHHLTQGGLHIHAEKVKK